MRVLVTGGTGFVGSRVVMHLARSGQYAISVLVRPTSDLNVLKPVADLVSIVECVPSAHRIEQAIRQIRPDVLVHIAASVLVSHRLDQVKELITANILFGTLLADAMVRNEVRALVNTGSFWEHMDGTDDYRPVNLYAATKRAFQDILKYYEDADGLHHVTLKLYGVYGPRDSRSKIFSLFRKSMTSAEPLKLSPGRQVMDLVYIDDVVSAYEKAIEYVYKDEAAGSATVSIGSGVGLSLYEIAKVYEDCVGHPLNIKWGGRSYRPREVMRSVADLEPAWRILGWKPSIDLKRGILHMLKEEGVIV